MWNFSSCLSEKGDFFMRVLFCKFHCPSFICFCKPSAHIYTTGPLKLENSPHVLNSNSNPTTTTTTNTTNSSVVSVSDEAIKRVKEEKEEEEDEDEQSVVDGKLHQNQNQNQNQNHNRNQQEEEEDDELEKENSVRSSIKKPITDSKGVEKKRVQWMDFLGKELAEVREFDARQPSGFPSDSSTVLGGHEPGYSESGVKKLKRKIPTMRTNTTEAAFARFYNPEALMVPALTISTGG